ncbi:hypothetical protein [Micromonospora carbonacea]|uniref:Uncharacterized protein n=1 Tax=Micromonospora carbonacea TaxID=47853 RepID=A0A1C5AZ11_9ACTN|nr:hypothetical protein [Micromonospora carbonacea]SCF50393.1 hypothetical protein GA0070563_13118 [Micromonospora carbonacea]
MTNAIDRITTPNLPTPGHLGQATAIEQSRAVAEVQAAVIAAKQMPRDIDRAMADMRRSCAQPALAVRAFFSFPRAGQAVSGPSIHLARELARCWGNIQYGVAELRRDDAAGISEMQAFAWDVETNTRSASIFIVPHRKDTQRGTKDITDLRDIYENNANQGARRVREAIFAVLPGWYTQEAQDLCRATIAGPVPDLGKKIDAAVQAYGKRGITVAQLEEKLGVRRADWGGEEFTQLDILFGSLRRGEISQDEAFPPARVTTDDLTAPAGA